MTSVRQAIEQREQAPKTPSLSSVVNQAVERQGPSLKALLPRGQEAVRFQNLVLTAVKSAPELMQCFATKQGEVSILLAVRQAAAIGLEPNTPLQEAWLLPRRSGQVMEAQLMIGYKGLLKLARRSGLVRSVRAEVVHQADDFHYALGLRPDIHHVPANGDRGDLTHAYAVIDYKDGALDFRVMDKAEIERHRAKSDSWRNERARPYSPWTVWPEAMWRKTVLRAVLGMAPLTADEAGAIEHDERVLTLDDGDVVEVKEDDTPQLPAAEPDHPDEPVEVEVLDDERPAHANQGDPSRIDRDTGELLPTHPWAGWGRDDWARWGRETGVKASDLKPMQSWEDVANAPYAQQVAVYALGVPDGEPFE